MSELLRRFLARPRAPKILLRSAWDLGIIVTQPTNQQNWQISEIGPSGVRALPLAAGINVGGHYKWHFFLFFSLSLFLSSGSLLILLEGVVVGTPILLGVQNSLQP